MGEVITWSSSPGTSSNLPPDELKMKTCQIQVSKSRKLIKSNSRPSDKRGIMHLAIFSPAGCNGPDELAIFVYIFISWTSC